MRSFWTARSGPSPRTPTPRSSSGRSATELAGGSEPAGTQPARSFVTPCEEVAVPTTQKHIDEIYVLIDKIETAMLTTRRADGRLVSRPMATQKREPIADLWCVADVESDKMDELEQDPHVNLAYFDSGSWEWVSVSGSARISTDREIIRRLY